MLPPTIGRRTHAAEQERNVLGAEIETALS
jgi:hypothetical protein